MPAPRPNLPQPKGDDPVFSDAVVRYLRDLSDYIDKLESKLKGKS